VSETPLAASDPGLEADAADAGRRAPTLASGNGGETAVGEDGALVTALDMALNGTPREETATYMRETFGVEREDILDEAYGKVGGHGARSRAHASGRR
jgi:hypothetical protein